MDESTGGDVGQRQGVARLDIGRGARADGIAHREALRRNDIALFSILILNKGDVGAAVGIVLEGQHLGGHIQLVPLEINDAVFPPVAAAAVTDSNPSIAVPPGFFVQGGEQAFLRLHLGQAAVIHDGHAAATRGGRLVILDWHSDSHS